MAGVDPKSVAFALSFVAILFYVIGSGWNHAVEVEYPTGNASHIYYGYFEYCTTYRKVESSGAYYKCEACK